MRKQYIYSVMIMLVLVAVLASGCTDIDSDTNAPIDIPVLRSDIEKVRIVTPTNYSNDIYLGYTVKTFDYIIYDNNDYAVVSFVDSRFAGTFVLVDGMQANSLVYIPAAEHVLL